MNLHLTILSITLVLAGCSESSAPTSILPEAVGTHEMTNNLFADVNPDGRTALERQGFRQARDRADKLVSGHYLNGYYQIDELINNLYVAPFVADYQDKQFDCANGGTAIGTKAGRDGSTITMIFEQCMIGDTVLTGSLIRTFSSIVTNSGFAFEVDLSFLALDIDTTTQSVTVTGSSNSVQTSSSNLDEGCGDEVGTRDSIARSLAISTATIESVAANTTVNNAQYQQELKNTHLGRPNGSNAPCGSPVQLIKFAGSATVTSSYFGESVALIGKSGGVVLSGSVGDISELRFDGPATLFVDFGDGSTLRVVEPSNTIGEVQADLTSGQVVMSILTDTRFTVM